MTKKRKKLNLTKNILLALVMGVSAWQNSPMAMANNVIANNTLPTNPQEIMGGINTSKPNDNTMNITQSQNNAIIKWDDFSIGANASVNFSKENGGAFNTLNYVNSGKLSQIYGTINAREGNIYLVNTAGVQITNSAQINVASLYVSNKNLDTPLSNINKNSNNVDINNILNQGKVSQNAALMSLGNINANSVTFDGGRIVLDTDRVRPLEQTDTTSMQDNITIKTTKEAYANKDVVLGYTAYDSSSGYKDKNTDEKLANLVVDGSTQNLTKKDGYMWVADLAQLQAIQTNTSGNFALRNDIDASSTAENSQKFNSLTGFTGNFDGLDNDIFNLNISGTGNSTGLFADANGSTIRNFSMIAGAISGSDNVGAIVGSATNSTIENITNTATVSGTNQVGGIVGSADNTTINGVENTASINGTMNVGGIVGSLTNDSNIIGDTGNMGSVTGSSYNVGGIAGIVKQSSIGNSGTGSSQIYNKLEVTGAYNVGGIAGTMQDGSTIQNVSNDGNITATGYTTEDYIYRTTDNIYGNFINGDILIQGDSDTFTEGYRIETVQVSNVGGIVGVAGNSESNTNKNTIQDVVNKGDITTAQELATDGANAYIGGNVGGIVGRSSNTDITNAENIENIVRGAHNVGGIAGYLEKGTIVEGVNNGGDILASGAVNKTDNGLKFIWSSVRNPNGSESNREKDGVGNVGGVVGYLFGDEAYVDKSGNRGTVHTEVIDSEENVRTTSNVGGVVGRIDRGTTVSMDDIKEGNSKLAVNNSYNTGSVSGYKAVGGIVGFMYNGEVANSYNLGSLSSSRKNAVGIDSLNMGGIVGDSTERTNAVANIYNVYNKGQIGDEDYIYYGRHVGGVVGRLSGNLEKAYNAGAIYNGYSVTGGIVGWWIKGSINNVYNTGNITVVNNDSTLSSSVGGIVGSVGTWELDSTLNLNNVYNLGTIRSFNADNGNGNSAGLIIGELHNYSTATPVINISNAYTLGNIYAYSENSSMNHISVLGTDLSKNTLPKFIKNVDNVFYIKPEVEGIFSNPNDLDGTDYTENKYTITSIEYKDRDKAESYGDLFKDGNWRIYEGTTPILNAFMPNSSANLGDGSSIDGITSVQYGTAYNPLLTIINVSKDITLDWQTLNATNQGSIAIYGGGLTIDNFVNNDNDGFYAGSIFTDGALTINSENNDVKIGSGSSLIASNININTGAGNLTIYGDVTATGDNTTTSQISLKGNNVTTYGKIQTSSGETTVNGIGINISDNIDYTNIGDASKDVPDLGVAYSHTVSGSQAAGDINITSSGDTNLYYGNEEVGFISSGGNLNIQAGGGAFLDSDLKVDKSISITSPEEILIDVSNIGKVQNPSNSTATMQNFLNHFSRNSENSFNFSSGTTGIDPNIKFTVDLWDDDKNAFDLNKFGSWNTNLGLIANLDINIDGQQIPALSGTNYVYLWVSSAEQLNALNKLFQSTADVYGSIKTFNIALKNDINLSSINDFDTIGTGNTKYDYEGIFDGRGNTILGLKNTDGGLFDSLSKYGVVENLNVTSATISGDSIGVIANTNKGSISNINGLGNSVKGNGTVGGIVGQNIKDTGTDNNQSGIISNVQDNSVVVGTTDEAVGGLAGSNGSGAIIQSSSSKSAVTNSAENGTSAGIGGIAGTNAGTLDTVTASGITNGLYKDISGNIIRESNNIGGIVGVNTGTLNSAYNESIVSGKNYVGGIVGDNNKGTVENVANATSVTSDNKTSDQDASKYTGGLAGSNNGTITNGRNNGTITGHDYVGGLVGISFSNSELTNLINDSSAKITGNNYVGGIVGDNAGKITTTDQELVNNGEIHGDNYVGGIAGKNEISGDIGTVRNDIDLLATSNNSKYFGGIVGYNAGLIRDATNNGNITAKGSTYVGGIAGYNIGLLEKAGNNGSVIGKDLVGGVAGKNESEAGISGVTIINTNTGKVFSSGGAGGIFGENTANIQYATLINEGEVFGNANINDDEVLFDEKDTVISGTGGIFGVNRGDISNSTLINSVDGTVSGTSNVGGLIGVNTGTISGGRDEADTYYKYQIYNNGKIVGDTGTNIGGLVGWNASLDGKTGSITGAYNTGHINITNGENVGGIVGKNDGKIDQVFNTAYEKVSDGNGGYVLQEGSIGGKTNVGGLVGNNTGTITNSYNMAKVSTGAGNAIGNNAGIATNIYATNTTGKLIAQGNKATHSYSFVSGDSSADHILSTSEQQKAEDSYNDFTNKNDDDVWRFYDGYQTPLLKMFLTKVSSNGTENDQNLVYNGQDQKLDIGELTGTSGTREDAPAWSANDDFDANVNSGGSLINHGNQISIDAGSYTDNWWSQQIGVGLDSINNLGYDLQATDYTISKKKLDASASDINHIYGNISPDNGYEFNISGWVDGEDYLIKDIILSGITDGSLTGNSNGKVTNDVGEYTWSGKLDVSKLENYDFGEGVTSIDIGAKSTVSKATININVSNSDVYKDMESPEYNGAISGIVNGDSVDTVFGSNWEWGIADPSLEEVIGAHNGVIGIKIGDTYYTATNQADLSNLLTNYDVQITPGNLTVRAPITVTPGGYDYLRQDAWSKLYDNRDRRAELNFVDGAISVDQDVNKEFVKTN